MSDNVKVMTRSSEISRLSKLERVYDISPQILTGQKSLNSLANSFKSGQASKEVMTINAKVSYDPKKVDKKWSLQVEKSKLTGQSNTFPDAFYNTFNPLVLDFTKFRDESPLLYKSIYDTMTNSDFDETMKINEFELPGIAWTEILDGQAVTRGQMKEGTSDSVSLKINGAGFTTTLRNQLFNKQWKDSMMIKANMIGYNAFLNDAHLAPIIAYSGYGSNDFNGKPRSTAAVSITGATYYENLFLTIKKGIRDAFARRLPNGFSDKASDKKVGQRFNSGILLTNEYDAVRVLEIMKGIPVADSKAYRDLKLPIGGIKGIQQIIGYEGDVISINDDQAPVTYAGVAENTAYLIYPKKGFKELIKQGLTPLVQAGDINKLAVNEFVWWDARGLIAQPQYYVQKITLPAASGEFA